MKMNLFIDFPNMRPILHWAQTSHSVDPHVPKLCRVRWWDPSGIQVRYVRTELLVYVFGVPIDKLDGGRFRLFVHDWPQPTPLAEERRADDEGWNTAIRSFGA